MKFEDLHWTESNIENVAVADRSLTVTASGVFCVGSATPCKVKVTFDKVATAKKEVTEYIGDPKSPEGFKEPYSIEELESQQASNLTTYGIEGISTFSPIAWLDLEVQAENVSVEKL